MGIFDRLRTAKGSAQLAAAADGLRGDLAAAEAKIADLNARRVAAIEAGDEAKLAAARTDLRVAEEHLADLQIAVESAERKSKEAAAREEADAIEKKMERAFAAREELVDLLKEAHPLARKLVDLADECRDLDREIRDLNTFATSVDRGDLRVELPFRDWAAGYTAHLSDAGVEQDRVRIQAELTTAESAVAAAGGELKSIRAELAALDRDAPARAPLVDREHRFKERLEQAENRVAALQKKQPRAPTGLAPSLVTFFANGLEIPGYRTAGVHWLEVAFPELAAAGGAADGLLHTLSGGRLGGNGKKPAAPTASA